MNKVYTRINWENEPSFNTPINEENLNAMDVAINELDDRVVELDTSKSNESEVLSLISDVSLDESTGTFTFTRKNGSTIKFDTKLEKIIVNFVFNHQTQTLDITLEDGTVQQIDLSALVTQYDFLDSDTIRCELKVENVYDESTFEHDIDYRNYGLPDVYYPNASEHIGKYYLDLSTGIVYNSKLADWSETEYVWSTIRLQLTLLSSNYKVVFHVVDGSITEDKINPNYLAQIRVETQKSESYMNSANQSAASAENSALRAEEAAEKAEAVTGITIDDALSETSKNPVQNKVITEELNKLEQDFSDSVSIKSETGENLIITDAINSPMLLNDWDKTLFEQEEYADGYNISSYSKNLSVNPQNGTVASQFNDALVDDYIFLPNRTYEFSFIGAAGHKFYANENLFINVGAFECTGEKQSILLVTQTTVPTYSGVAIFKNNVGNAVMPNFTDFKIRLTSTVTVKSNTKAPILLESYDEYTEIDAPSYVSVAYAVNDTGKNLLKYTDPTILKSDNILSTVTECEASTNSTDIAGASAVAELYNNFAVVTGTFPSDIGTGTFSDTYPYPDGFTYDNCFVLNLEILLNEEYRSGEGLYGSPDRQFVSRTADGVKAYTINSGFAGCKFNIILIKK